jgi:hypothetical protein
LKPTLALSQLCDVMFTNAKHKKAARKPLMI